MSYAQHISYTERVEAAVDAEYPPEAAIFLCGTGKGFAIRHHQQGGEARYLVTAAHSLPHPPPAGGIGTSGECYYRNLVGRVPEGLLGLATRVAAQPVYCDLASDVAVLGRVNPAIDEPEAQAFENLLAACAPLPIGIPHFKREVSYGDDGKRLRGAYVSRETVQVYDRGAWQPATMEARLRWARLTGLDIRPDLSGSPVLLNGQAIALCCATDDQNAHIVPILMACLPGWLLPRE